MIDLIDIISKIIPISILLSLSFTVAFGWLIKQLRNYQTNGDVLKDRSFIIVSLFLILGNAGYYTYQLYESYKIDYIFSDNKYGIYILNFEGDDTQKNEKLLKASLKSKLKQESIEIYLSKKHNSELSGSINEFIKQRNISLLLNATLIPNSSDSFIEYAQPNDNSWTSLRQKINITNPESLVDYIEKNQNKNKDDTLEKLSSMSNAISSLAYQNEITSKRLNALESSLLKINNVETLGKEENVVSSQENGNKYLISIGVNNYKNLQFRLNYATDDAREIGKVFSKNNYQTELILDQSATKANIQQAIVDKLGSVTNKKDTVILYYSGHSFVKKDVNGKEMGFLCPYDTDMDNIYSTCISMTEIQDWFRLIPAEKLVFIIDSCISGLAGTQTNYKDLTIIQKDSTIAPIAKFTPDKPTIFDTLSSGDRVIFSACKDDQQASEKSSLKHGLFTYYVLTGLNGEADLNNDGKITIEELYYYVSPKVSIYSSGSQEPQLFQWGKADLSIITGLPTVKSR